MRNFPRVVTMKKVSGGDEFIRAILKDFIVLKPFVIVTFECYMTEIKFD